MSDIDTVPRDGARNERAVTSDTPPKNGPGSGNATTAVPTATANRPATDPPFASTVTANLCSARGHLLGFSTMSALSDSHEPIAGVVGSATARAPAALLESGGGHEDRATERWRRVELRAERLDWLPPVLASLDRPFIIECRDELRDLVIALADRLTSYAAEPDRAEPMS
ncbi:hypothetical protein ACFXD5_23480 [Streptomyces sp. NPDC059385]|uniref:hypothetical protein n=1 Tax=Streptomyces sp. NPDC059385 TaxID=3346817 RepID=UPI00367B780A